MPSVPLSPYMPACSLGSSLHLLTQPRMHRRTQPLGQGDHGQVVTSQWSQLQLQQGVGHGQPARA